MRWGINAWLVAGLAVVFAMGWYAAGLLRIVIAPLVLAIFPAAILVPLPRWLVRRGWNESAAALAAVTLFVATLLGVLTLLGLQVRSELSGVTEQLRSSMQQFEEATANLPMLSDLQLSSMLETGGSGSGGGQETEQVRDAAVTVGRSVSRFFAQLFLGLVAVFFYVRDGDRIGAWLAGLFPPRHQDDAGEVGATTWRTVSGYIRGQTVVATVDGVLVAVGLFILGVPLAAALGAIVFIGAYVPIVGSITAGAIAVLVALVTEGLVAALITLAIIVGVQQLEGNVLAPIVLGRELEVHPLAILVAILAGASLLGVFGAIIAAPLVASIHKAAGYIRNEVA